MNCGIILNFEKVENNVTKFQFFVGRAARCINTEILAILRKNKNVGLLIVDSTATTFRSEYDTNHFARIRDLKAVGQALHNLAFEENLVLVTINQVRRKLKRKYSTNLNS